MGKMNMGRVLLGGLLAGLVINIGEFVLNDTIFGKDWEAAMQALNRPTFEASAIIWFVVLGFLLGIGTIWVYAAIRPRFSPGPKTAVVAGLTVWALAYLFPAFGYSAMGLFPAKLVWGGTAWGLFEVPIASLIGAWPYKEA